ncbi:MAG: HEAT repeat domain-containing protein [Candidatus Woesearchaeota archaeon]
MNIEQILNEVERERRKVLVCRMYDEGMKSDDDAVRKGIVECLGALAEIDVEKFVELYKTGIKDKDWHVRRGIVESLTALAQVDAEKFVELYERGIKDKDWHVRERTAEYLTALAQVNPEKFVELYKKGIKDENEDVRRGTAESLTALAQVDAEKFVELYEIGIKDENKDIRRGTAEYLTALAQVNPEKFVELCEIGIKDENEDVRRGIAESLTALAQVNPEKFVKLYERGIKDEDWHVRERTAESLTALAQVDAEKFVELCEIGIKDKDWHVRERTAESLTALAQVDAEKFVELYEIGIKDKDWHVRERTAKYLTALAQVNPEKFVELYKKGIKDDYGDVRRKTAESLSALSSTIQDETLIPIQDKEYKFLFAYLNSKYVEKEGDELKQPEKVLAELKALVRTPDVDYQKMMAILKAGQATNLDEMVECATINIPEYIIIKKLGSGGSRDAYLARREYCDNDTVLKFFRSGFLKERVTDQRSRNELEEIFIREINNIRRFDHPNLIRIFDFGRYKDTFYLEEEYMEGGTFEDYVMNMSDAYLILTIALYRLVEIAGCVNYLHSKGKVVRDIKLDNILLSSDHRKAKLDDLEFMGEIGKQTKYSEITFGSNRYAAPELIKGEPASVESDIYAIGCCLFYILTRNEDRDFFARINKLPEKEYTEALEIAIRRFDEEYFSSLLNLHPITCDIDEVELCHYIFVKNGVELHEVLFGFLAYEPSNRIQLKEAAKLRKIVKDIEDPNNYLSMLMAIRRYDAHLEDPNI